MRLIGKLLALPFVLVTGILYLVCKFVVVLCWGFYQGSYFWRRWRCSLQPGSGRGFHGW